MNAGFLITARLKSKRLPNKIIKKVENKMLLSHMIDRIKKIKKIKKIIVCTTDLKGDKKILDVCKKNKVNYYKGDSLDVLNRLYCAAKKFKLDYIVNITADCPLVEPYYIDQIIKTYEKKKYDLIRAFDLPHGSFSYGINIKALKKIIELKDKRDTEVWERYFTDTGLFNIHELKIKNKFHIKPGLRMTLDYPEDLTFLKKIFKELYKKEKIFNLTQIIKLLKRKPEIIQINKNCSKKFEKKYNSQSNIKIKKISNLVKHRKKYKTYSDFMRERSI